MRYHAACDLAALPFKLRSYAGVKMVDGKAQGDNPDYEFLYSWEAGFSFASLDTPIRLETLKTEPWKREFPVEAVFEDNFARLICFTRA